VSWALLTACETDSGSTSASGTGGSVGSGGSGLAVPCGDALECQSGEACVATEVPAACTDKVNADAPCPGGTSDTLCGGAGFPCCCEPAPPPTRECVVATDCNGEPSCACLPDACDVGYQCFDQADGELYCAELPKP
jgi:hypothetical protein